MSHEYNHSSGDSRISKAYFAKAYNNYSFKPGIMHGNDGIALVSLRIA